MIDKRRAGSAGCSTPVISGLQRFLLRANTTQTQGTTGAIFVYGGKFLHFDPSKGDDSSTSNGGSNSSVQSSYLAEGYVSVASGEYFIVQEA